MREHWRENDNNVTMDVPEFLTINETTMNKLYSHISMIIIFMGVLPITIGITIKNKQLKTDEN
jgi:hypothetical protein